MTDEEIENYTKQLTATRDELLATRNTLEEQLDAKEEDFHIKYRDKELAKCRLHEVQNPTIPENVDRILSKLANWAVSQNSPNPSMRMDKEILYHMCLVLAWFRLEKEAKAVLVAEKSERARPRKEALPQDAKPQLSDMADQDFGWGLADEVTGEQ